jgi:hypothetical protein
LRRHQFLQERCRHVNMIIIIIITYNYIARAQDLDLD